jgi:hypothetical protein
LHRPLPLPKMAGAGKVPCKTGEGLPLSLFNFDLLGLVFVFLGHGQGQNAIFVNSLDLTFIISPGSLRLREKDPKEASWR